MQSQRWRRRQRCLRATMGPAACGMPWQLSSVHLGGRLYRAGRAHMKSVTPATVAACPSAHIGPVQCALADQSTLVSQNTWVTCIWSTSRSWPCSLAQSCVQQQPALQNAAWYRGQVMASWPALASEWLWQPDALLGPPWGLWCCHALHAGSCVLPGRPTVCIPRNACCAAAMSTPSLSEAFLRPDPPRLLGQGFQPRQLSPEHKEQARPKSHCCVGQHIKPVPHPVALPAGGCAGVGRLGSFP